MAKALNNSKEKQQYEVLKECWIKGTRYLPSQLIQLTEVEAKEWLDRKCIKLVTNKKEKTK